MEIPEGLHQYLRLLNSQVLIISIYHCLQVLFRLQRSKVLAYLWNMLFDLDLLPICWGARLSYGVLYYFGSQNFAIRPYVLVLDDTVQRHHIKWHCIHLRNSILLKWKYFSDQRILRQLEKYLNCLSIEVAVGFVHFLEKDLDAVVVFGFEGCLDKSSVVYVWNDIKLLRWQSKCLRISQEVSNAV